MLRVQTRMLRQAESFIAPMTSWLEIIEKMHNIVQSHFQEHPFEQGIRRHNREYVLRNYYAMSQAFPYLQAASQGPLIANAMKKNQSVPPDVEATSVVGNFLCWDETGGNQLMRERGFSALPEILKTHDLFHSHLLRKDLLALFGARKITPDYSPDTRKYLTALLKRLSSLDPVIRASMMAGFETHANDMISALWNAVSKEFNVAKDDLEYFRTHVGGSDPAEKYHVEMTQKMLQQVVPTKKQQQFLEEFKKSYGLNFSWCQNLVNHTTAGQMRST